MALAGICNDTLVSTIEKQYGRDFEVRGDMQLGTLLEETGKASLNDLIKSKLGRS